MTATLSAAIVLLLAPLAHAADISARDVAIALHAATAGKPVDFSGSDLSNLDLAGLDFKAAVLARVHLNATDLTGAKLAGSDLTGAQLGRTTLIRADFSGANLSGANLMMPAVSTTFDINPADAPRFTAATLTGARMLVRFRNVDFSRANLRHANLSPHASASFNSKLLRTSLSSCKLNSVDFSHADLRGVLFEYSDLSHADLTGADLSGADFTGSNLTQANFTNAKVDNADFTGAVLGKAIGLDQARGNERAKNIVRTP